MKNQVIKFFVLCAIVCGVTIGANAQTTAAPQGKMTPQQRSEMRLNKMKTDLTLTDDQVSKIKPLLDAEASARASGDKSSMKTSRDNMDAQMSKILTADQMTKYNQMKAQMKGRMHSDGAKQDN